MNGLKTIWLLAKYNFKILFGGRYLIFMVLSFIFFCYLLFNSAYSGNALTEVVVYANLIFPSLLLIFYPTTYGVQRDEEAKILEIFFCIPNYMYKVWLLRLIFVFIACFANVLLFSYAAHLLLCPVSIFKMTYQTMFVVVLFGSMAFFLSTFIKSGNGVAIVLLGLFALLVFISGSFFENSMWHILINPFDEPTDIHPDIWQSTLSHSRILLSCCSLGLLLLSLNNLRRRESLL